MKQNKLKEKWNSLPWYARDVVWRGMAAVAVLLLLMGASAVIENNKSKKAVEKTDKEAQTVRELPEKYLQFREAYIKEQQQKQK